MLIHFRREGKVHRTICGQRWHPSRRPRIWRREWNESPPIPEATPEQVNDRLRHACPECLNTVAADADRAKLKAELRRSKGFEDRETLEGDR